MKTFDHEKLEVYRISIAFLAYVNTTIKTIPRGNGHLCDQLTRAATSITLNIAEGAGEFSGPEKARFYRMAKRSATECAAILDACVTMEAIEADTAVPGREKLLSIVSMLVKLVRAVA